MKSYIFPLEMTRNSFMCNSDCWWPSVSAIFCIWSASQSFYAKKSSFSLTVKWILFDYVSLPQIKTRLYNFKSFFWLFLIICFFTLTVHDLQPFGSTQVSCLTFFISVDNQWIYDVLGLCMTHKIVNCQSSHHHQTFKQIQSSPLIIYNLAHTFATTLIQLACHYHIALA